MNRSKPFRWLSLLLCLVMVLGLFPTTTLAYNPDFQSETHTVFRHTEATLAPGVEQYINYAYANDGEQNVYFVTTADITRDDVIVQTSYMDQYRDQKLGMSKLTDQIASANAYYSDPESPQFISEYYNVVAGVNASFFNMKTGQPTGVCWIDGVNFGTNEYPAFFAILTDGSAVIDDRGNAGNYDIWQAVGGSQWLVRNGADVTASASGSYNTDRHCRTAVGITAEGKVVTMVLDGRQSPYSIGGSMHEIAQIMLEAGCVAAINLDGGGSTTYAAKQEGEDTVRIVDRPSDGSERAISAGLIIASIAPPSNVFDHATLTAADDYISANASTVVSVKGISPAGTSAEIPAEAYLTTDNGTISADGVLTPASVGDATVQMIYNDAVVGETVIHVVVPDSIEFSVATLAAPYGKDADITMIAKYGEFNLPVKCVAEDYAFALSDAKFGSVEGFVFHATNDTTVTGSGTITATFVGSDRTATVPLTVGKGSEVLFDFESDVDNHQTARWSGYDGYNAGIVTTCTPVTAETGKVHSGSYAMAYDMDFSQLTYYEDYTYSLMCYNWDDIQAHGFTTDADGVKQRGAEEDFIDITGATGLGMWIYIPDEIDVRGLDVRYTIGGKKAPTAAYERVNSAMGVLFPYRDGLGTDGWYYYYFDLSNYSSWPCLRLQNCRTSNNINKNGKYSELYGDVMQLYVNDRAWKDTDKQFKSYTSHVTLYIDDITVDYSSVVPDREAPVFTNPTYAFKGASDAIALNDNAAITASGLEFAVAVAENTKKSNATGLNAASVKAYIDGNEVEATFKNGKVAIPETVLADGTHTVTFEAADNTGNTSHITRTFTVNAGSDLDTVKVVARNADMTVTPVGSLYYIDLVATDISKVSSVKTTLKVNNVNDWEPQGIETADGFSAAYQVSNFDKGLIDLTVTRDKATDASGEAVVASIPVRTWYPHNALGKDSTWIITQKNCVYPMDTQVFTKAGVAYDADGNATYFSAPAIQCDSEAMCEYGYIGVNKGNEGGTVTVTSWHEHNAAALPDKAATCTEPGYTGRTFCEECGSVIDWGTTVPALGHSYAVDPADGLMKCAGCGDLFTGELDGKTYADGALAQGWQGSKYFVDGQFVTGVYNVEDVYYEFGEDGESLGKYTGLVQDAEGVYHYAKFGEPAGGWFEIDEEWYYFDTETLAPVAEKTFTYPNSKAVTTYQFEANGKIVDGVWVELSAGTRYYYGPDFYKLTAKTGNIWFADIHGVTYGFDGSGFRYEGLCFVKQSNNPQYLANFADDGAYLGPYTGIYEGSYYEDGFVAKLGKMIKLDDTYYYITQQGKVYTNGTLYMNEAMTNGFFSAGNYTFDENGALVLKQGIVDGYYYENGELVKGKGLVEYEGALYFVKQNGAVYVGNDLFVSEAKANGYVASGSYDFDEDGKMIRKDGVIDGFYYENGSLVKGKGLVKIGNDLYFVKQNGAVYVGNGLYVSEAKANGLMAPGTYDFGEDGKMIRKDGVIDGFYYENGVLVKGKGLVKIGNDLYFVKQNGAVYVGNGLHVPASKTNGLMPAGIYNFGPDGKMILD